MRPSEQGLRTTGLRELYSQSQPSWRGCRSRELQDQRFTFCRRFVTASIFSTIFSMRPSWNENQHQKYRGNMSLYKAKVMFAASERQCTAAGGKSKYLGLVFTSDWRRTEEIDKANAVLCEFHRSVVTKRELSNNAKLSVFKSVCVPILPYDRESWVMTERILIQVQAPKMGFLRRVRCVTKGIPRWRGAGARKKFGASIFEPKIFWEKMFCIEKKLATLLGLFGALQW